jgi:hypothetical protein
MWPHILNSLERTQTGLQKIQSMLQGSEGAGQINKYLRLVVKGVKKIEKSGEQSLKGAEFKLKILTCTGHRTGYTGMDSRCRNVYRGVGQSIKA